MNYREAREYLDALSKFGSILGLDRMTGLMERLGNPHHNLQFVHVAGTNGKGSVTAMTSSILQASGLKVGRYISPYLEDFTERIAVNSRNISEDRVAQILTRTEPEVEAMARAGQQPTEFEVITAMGFLYFLEERCDIVCLEVGLGGRFDATNVIRDPLVSAITEIGMDHMDRLGKTLGKIAREKAGIIKPGSPVVSAPQKPSALKVLEGTSRKTGSRLFLGGRDITWRERHSGIDGQTVDYAGLLGDYPEVRIPLLGRHQQENAAVALGSVECLLSRGYEVSPKAIYEGFAKTSWPGRLEVMARDPLVVIDGAHNLDGILRLAETVRTVLPHRRLVLVLGVLTDKDVEGMIKALVPVTSYAVTTRPASLRSMDPVTLAGMLGRQGLEAKAIEDIPRALDCALDCAGPEDMVLVAGSIYLAGPARTYLRSKTQELSGTQRIYL
ncbi:MAG: folylpolyglutamate synthase/dihydrofolate synthase family protein [Bacillota bacterium]